MYISAAKTATVTSFGLGLYGLLPWPISVLELFEPLGEGSYMLGAGT